MTLRYQIPRNSLAWMMIAQLSVVLPHVTRLPVWVIGICIACGIWRVMVYKGQLPYPPWWIRAGFICVAFAGVFMTYGKFFQLQPMVTILILAFYLKLIEMHKRRDAYVVIFLAYFIITTAFIYDQSILLALYMFLTVFLVTTALIGLTQSQGHKKPLHSFKLTSKLILQSIPLMLVMFIFFPRIPPLWSVPMDNSTSMTGVGDSMSPGDIANLGQSSELAFRAKFETVVPDMSDLYWRGLVFEYFDGRKWEQGDRVEHEGMSLVRYYGQKIPDWESNIIKRGEPFKYTVMLESTNQPWLFSLPIAETNTRHVGFTRDFRLVRDTKVKKRFEYSVTSYPDYKIDADIPEWIYEKNIQLPVWGNKKSRELAKQWMAESEDTNDFIQRALSFYNKSFIYTLQPPRLGVNSIDEFLFTTQKGFCEHYASSFVFLMRSAGIPARVVVGYMGGEINPYENYVMVHQFDAHAWAEVWMSGVGWQRVDPTASVAPSRVESGLQGALQSEAFLSSRPFSPVHLRKVPILGALRMRMDQINYAWVRFVVGYNPTIQRDFLTKILGKFTPQRMAIAILIFFSLAIGFIALSFYQFKIKAVIDPVVEIYQRYCRRLEKVNIHREISETPGEFAERVILERPDLKVDVDIITERFYFLSYITEEYSALDIKQFSERVDKFKPAKLRDDRGIAWR